jgi:hypothetical protein
MTQNRVALYLRAGYACTRAAASLGAWDIIGIGSTDIVLCQVKTRDWPGTVEMETLKAFHADITAGSWCIAGGIDSAHPTCRRCRMPECPRYAINAVNAIIPHAAFLLVRPSPPVVEFLPAITSFESVDTQ